VEIAFIGAAAAASGNAVAGVPAARHGNGSKVEMMVAAHMTAMLQDLLLR
jgi:hypothetical protein